MNQYFQQFNHYLPDFLVKNHVYIHNLVLASIFVLLALFFKKYLSKVTSKVVFFFFKKYADNYYVHTFEEKVLFPLQGLLATIFFYTAANQFNYILENFIVFQRGKNKNAAAIEISMIDVVDTVFRLFFIYYITLFVVRVITFLFEVIIDNLKKKNDVERMQILPLLRDMIRVVVWAIGLLTILGSVFQVNVGALIAGLGIGGIAIAFALKDSVENLLASILVMIDRPFKLGDWIIVNGVEGNVERIGFRSTRIRTFEKTLMIIPNRKLIENNLENFTERNLRRQKLTVGAIYGLSLKTYDKTIAALKDAIDNVNGTSGASEVILDNFGDSSVNIAITYFVDLSSDYSFSSVREQVNKKIYEVMYQYAKGFAYNTVLNIPGEDVNEVNAIDA